MGTKILNDLQTSVFATEGIEYERQPELYPELENVNQVYGELKEIDIIEAISESFSDECQSAAYFNLESATTTNEIKNKPSEIDYIKNFFLKKAINRLNSILKLDAEYFHSESIELPNDKVIDNTFRLLRLLAVKSIFPNKISTSVEEGICLTFKKDQLVLFLELYYSNEIGYLIENTLKHEILGNEDIASVDEGASIIIDFFTDYAFPKTSY